MKKLGRTTNKKTVKESDSTKELKNNINNMNKKINNINKVLVNIIMKNN